MSLWDRGIAPPLSLFTLVVVVARVRASDEIRHMHDGREILAPRHTTATRYQYTVHVRPIGVGVVRDRHLKSGPLSVTLPQTHIFVAGASLWPEV